MTAKEYINVFYCLREAHECGETRNPGVVIKEFGIEYDEWESQPIADQIKLHGVDSSTLPDPLPPFLDVQILIVEQAPVCKRLPTLPKWQKGA